MATKGDFAALVLRIFSFENIVSFLVSYRESNLNTDGMKQASEFDLRFDSCQEASSSRDTLKNVYFGREHQTITS